ncbi:sigma-70 family RNA polymerase sigma factor [Tsukamurella soli]|uniref:sigma-70 family RNA polymerase sigma factor n=1 Tax=Tsukamurella soli TaxID=644556 RepID=UPI0031E7832A
MDDALVRRFEEHRDHVRMVAFRVLGSLESAEDAVQETWIRLASSDADAIANLPGWLTTAVSRICLDMLRAQRSRPRELIGHPLPDVVDPATTGDPEHEALLVDSVGRALLVVLDRLSPEERVAFVLHDAFGVPFDRLAPVVGRSPSTTKKLASRARRKVRGDTAVSATELAERRRVVEAFLAAARAGDIDAVTAVLAPDVVRRADRAAIPADRPAEVRGARKVADEIAVFGRRARFAAPLLVDGDVGLVVASRARPELVLTFEFADHRITGYELIADPARLACLTLAVLP